MTEDLRPHVMVMSAVTLDGKVTIRRGMTSGSFAPLVSVDIAKRHHLERASVDAVLVGANTVVIDDPSLTVRAVAGRNPARVVPDPEGVIPLHAKILTDGKAPTIIAVSETTPEQRCSDLRRLGAEVVVCGAGPFVDLRSLLTRLYNRGIRRLMVEGGATINWVFLKEGLVDELAVFKLPLVVGGCGTTTFAEGSEPSSVEQVVLLGRPDVELIGDVLLLRYKLDSQREPSPERRQIRTA